VASDDQESRVWSEAHAFNWKAPVEIKQLETLKLEVGTIVFIYLENLKNTFLISSDKVLSIWREITGLCLMS
jgi:hypothetical protein